MIITMAVNRVPFQMTPCTLKHVRRSPFNVLMEENNLFVIVKQKYQEGDIDAVEDYVKKVKVGRDGLIIRSDFGSGLLLPQVAVEWGWNAEEFLMNTCRKACLNKDCWKDLSNRIYKFHAQIFKED